MPSPIILALDLIKKDIEKEKSAAEEHRKASDRRREGVHRLLQTASDAIGAGNLDGFNLAFEEYKKQIQESEKESAAARDIDNQIIGKYTAMRLVAEADKEAAKDK